MMAFRPFDQDGAAVPIGGAMRRRAVRSAAARVVSSGVSVALGLLTIPVLARLLTPEDFGLVTMVVTFSTLLAQFGLNGFTEAVIKWDRLNHTVASNLFWINLAISVSLSIGFAAAGSQLARFYGDDRIQLIAVAISLMIFFSSLRMMHAALLKRAMRFPVLSANDLTGSVISVGVAIGLAFNGWGYWALVVRAVLQPLCQAVGVFILCPWVPSLPRRAAETGAMVRFGLQIFGRYAVSYWARNVDYVLVGWRFGEQSLGFYKKAYDLFALSASQLVLPLTNVAQAALSRLEPTSKAFRRSLLKALGVLAFVGMGVGTILTLTGRDVIRILLGPGWEASGDIFMLFGPGVGVMLLYRAHGWIHISIGTANRWFIWTVIELVVTFSFFLAGLPWGAAGVALAWTVSYWVLVIPAFWYAGKPIDFSARDVVQIVWKYVAASVFAGVVTAGVMSVVDARYLTGMADVPAAILRILLSSVCFAAVYLTGVVTLHGGAEPLYEIRRLAGELMPERWKPANSVAVETGSNA